MSPNGTATTTDARRRPAAGRRPTTTAPRPGGDAAPSQVTSPPPFNLNTISRGVTTADFYSAVPTAIVKFLESRHAHEARGQAAAARRGRHEADVQSSATRFPSSRRATCRSRRGGAGQNPLSSYNYKDVGVNVDMTPRVTLENDIILDLSVDQQLAQRRRDHCRRQHPVVRQSRSERRGCGCATASRTCSPGLLREDERKSLTGFPGRDPRAVSASSCSRATTIRSRRPTS